jgi:hypothetical protein
LSVPRQFKKIVVIWDYPKRQVAPDGAQRSLHEHEAHPVRRMSQGDYFL